MAKPLIGKVTLENQIEDSLGMTEEEAAALDKEEAATEEEEATIAAEEKEAADKAKKAEAEAEAERVEKERLDALSEEERAAEEEAAAGEEEEEDDDIIIGGDSEDGDDPLKKKEEKSNTQITEEAFFEFASKNLGREVKSFDDLNQQLPAEFANEQLENINNFVKDTDRDVFDWFKMQQLNVGGMDDEQLVKTQLAIKYPTLRPHEIDRKFNREYKLDADSFTEDEVSDARLDLKIDAEAAKTDLAKLSDGYKVPATKEKKVNDGVAQREAQRVKAAYVEQMVKDVDAIATFDFEVAGSKVKYKPNRVDRKQIKDLNQNLETFFDQFRNEDGSLNTNELSEGLWKATKGNVEKLLTAVKSRYTSEGAGKHIRKQKNSKLPDNSGVQGKMPTSEEEIQTELEKVLKQESRGGKNEGMKVIF